MRAKLEASASLLSICVIFLFALTPLVPAAGVPLSPAHAARDQPRKQEARPGVFPFVAWLRDSAAKLIWDSPPASPPIKQTAAPSIGALNPRYAKETVIRFNVSSHEEEDALADAADRLFLDVWAFTRNFVDIRLHKNDLKPLLKVLPKSLRSKFSTLIPDLQAAVLATYPESTVSRGGVGSDAEVESERRLAASDLRPKSEFDDVFFHDFQPLSVIYRWMGLIESMYPNIARVEKIGTSFEGRDILGLRVGIFPEDGDDDTALKTLVINGGLHAREWVASSTVNYLAWSLIYAYGDEPVITKLIDNFSTVFIPVVNPDGYEYTWNGDRLWRKSRQDTPVNFCRGLDLDHAFGFEWDANLPEPCSESYGGEQPFQAVEAQALSDWAKNETEENGAKFVGFIDLHSYSQEVLYPYSFTCDTEPPNVENLQELGIGIAKAIRLASGETYDVLPACEGAVSARKGGRRVHRIESSGGSAIDWFYHEMHAKFSYQIKLRDRGSYGFLLPRDEIIPTGEEILNAIKYYADFLLGNNGIEKPTGTPSPVSSVHDPESPADQDGSEVAPEPSEWKDLKKRRRR